MIWETITDDEDKINDDIRSGLPTRKPLYPAHRGVPVPDRSVHGGWAMRIMTEDEEKAFDRAYEAQDRPTRLVTPELAFVAIMIGFGLVLIVGALLGIVEVGHE